ncbi:MAG TPA: FAD-dependent oxidoreductase [Candidatus Limnocylindria bacterium]|nr:FAD-dependent oxidoreductase [Candidatus Limnocylindria bacterium]
MDRIVIVGASLAGASAAFALREAGFTGSITLVGEEPQLPYERPPLSKAYLRGEEDLEKAYVRPADAYVEQEIDLRLGTRAVTIDRAARRVTLEDRTELAYDRLLLATGAEARRIGVPGSDLANVHVLRTVADADAIRAAAASAERIVVVGGGWIGSEVAASLRQVGRAVTLVTNLPNPLEGVLGPEVASVYADLHRANGIHLVAGRATGFDGDRSVTGVRLQRGTVLPADLVVVGVGAAPRVELARRAGLEVAPSGIAVDEQLRTSDPAIHAAGDVAAAWHPRYAERLRVEHWDNAREQGATAARNMLGAGEPYDRTPYFYSDQFDLGMEARGLLRDWDEVVIRGDAAAREFVAFWLRAGRVVAAMNANVWDVGEQLAALVDSGASVDAARLADPTLPLEPAA